MNARVADVISDVPERRGLAGDQLYLDFDLAESSCPGGTQLCIGSAVLEITGKPHLGCGEFVQRFGPDALKFVNAPAHRPLRFRGAHARVVVSGRVQVGDPVFRKW